MKLDISKYSQKFKGLKGKMNWGVAAIIGLTGAYGGK
jgi:hypothetical protein